MNIFRAFMELDEVYNNRQNLIDQLKALGKHYHFDKYSDAQLYRMLQKAQLEKRPIRQTAVLKEPVNELDIDFDILEPKYCECGTQLTDFGQCPVCDLGETNL
jgi:phage terminase large subunit-like protein